MYFSKRRWLIGALAAVLAAVTFAAYLIAERVALRSLRESTTHRQDLYVANLESEMRRYEYLPQVVGFDPRVAELLEQEINPTTRQLVNEHLQSVSNLAGAAAIYVMDMKGVTLAASNWNEAASFVNMQFAYRLYFQDAARGLVGRFYGVGTVSREPGYYFANAVWSHGRIVGVAAVKVNLDKLDGTWAHSGEQIAVADGNGVVFLSSEPQWKFKTLRDLSTETRGRLDATRQYWKAGSLGSLGLTQRGVLDDGTAIVEVGGRSAAGSALRGMQYLVHGSKVQGTDWKLLVMADTAPARETARLGAVLTALTLVLIGTLCLYVKQRYRIVAQTIAARAALQCANDELEQKVRARTEALSEANDHLQTEIGERRRAEDALRETLRDLVHTAKMAVLGKMSASITHELNQPLAALQTLSENTVTLLERALFDDAKTNLRMIGKTVARMGIITGQLKKFARRSDVELAPTQVNLVLTDALFLLKQSVRSRHIELSHSVPPEGIWAVCNGNRLEQVLVNLVSNAADAVAQVEGAKVEVLMHQSGEVVAIEVHDNGPGLGELADGHLFEPFFTTKDQGVGLGLGLAISNDIVRHFGGTLRAERSKRLGGALFVVELRAAEEHEELT